jgi:hypothetical protein
MLLKILLVLTKCINIALLCPFIGLTLFYTAYPVKKSEHKPAFGGLLDIHILDD